MPARKHVIKVRFGGHHDRAFFVPQPFNEPEHFLAPLEIEGSDLPEAGAVITADRKAVGEIASSAWSPARGRIVALGYLRLGEISQGEALACAGRPAHLMADR